MLIATHDIAAEARAVAAALVSVIGPQRQALHPMCVRPYHAPWLRRSLAGAASWPAAGGLSRWRRQHEGQGACGDSEKAHGSLLHGLASRLPRLLRQRTEGTEVRGMSRTAGGREQGGRMPHLDRTGPGTIGDGTSEILLFVGNYTQSAGFPIHSSDVSLLPKPHNWRRRRSSRGPPFSCLARAKATQPEKSCRAA